ncbi:tRNA (guanosine(37)-N1)-methyltransferase TrmD [Patescibacteria group bacterium]|nr:tRNA (guanosine(37)-N1)-methyltransferase TrmD [Patescibacteria group bacterium]
MHKINIVTLFPQVFEKFLELIPYKNLIKNGTLQINIINLRDFGMGNYNKVDDKPYGGGPGMVLMIEPIFNALQTVESTSNHKILLSPRGKRYTQQRATELKNLNEITLICGRYEGVDARVEEMCDELISVGDFVLAGGEVAALCVMESVLRLCEGALGDSESILDESFTQSDHNQIEYPQYTRPEEFNGKKVPQELLSGNHKLIAQWRSNNKLPKQN